MFGRAAIAIACVVAMFDAYAQEPQTPAVPSTVFRVSELVGNVTDYVVSRGDTVRSIGARFGVDPTILARDNSMQAGSKLAIGQILRIDSRHIVPATLDSVELVVNIPQ